MKHLTIAINLIATLFVLLLGEAGAGVSISIGEPGFYGRIELGVSRKCDYEFWLVRQDF